MLQKLSHMLRVVYPPFIFGVALVAWASIDSAQVVRSLPPPVGGGFNSWTPILSQYPQCEKKQNRDFLFQKGCSFEDEIRQHKSISN